MSSMRSASSSTTNLKCSSVSVPRPMWSNTRPGVPTTKAAPLSDGVVKKVDKAAGEIVIQHGPVESIGMPAMTMAFGVADKSWLNLLKAGDKIRFSAVLKNGNAIVSRYEIVK